jgi:hypothetical protein
MLTVYPPSKSNNKKVVYLPKIDEYSFSQKLLFSRTVKVNKLFSFINFRPKVDELGSNVSKLFSSSENVDK